MNKEALFDSFIEVTLFMLSHQDILFSGDNKIDIRLKAFQDGSTASTTLFISRDKKEIEAIKLSECIFSERIEYVTFIDLFLYRLFSHIKPHVKEMEYVHVCPECNQVHVNNSMYFDRNYVCSKCICAQTPSKKNSHGYVYFFESVLTGLIKIGYSGNIKRRQKEIESMQGGKLNLLKMIHTSPKHEKYLHERFAHLKTHGEWFLPDPELKDFIKTLSALD